MRKIFTSLTAVTLLTALGLQAQPCPAPTNVTATPSMICPGDAAQLNATSAGNTISWYTLPSGGSAIGTSASGANFSVSPTATTTYYAEAAGAVAGSQTFSFTGSAQTFTVPSGITSIDISAQGAQGTAGTAVASQPGGTGGLGGTATGTLSVTPGQVLTIYVGGQNGFNGGGSPGTPAVNTGGSPSYACGGGGGASDVRTGAAALADRVLVAAGGGGGSAAPQGSCASGPGGAGGNGGGATGVTGTTGNGCGSGGVGGTGGTSSAGGTGGVGNSNCSGTGVTGGAGVLGVGGNGGNGLQGCGGYTGAGGGGGGGGYFGGGGGGGAAGGGGGAWSGGGGGGGSSYVGGVTSGTTTAGTRSGNGEVVISWTGTGCTASARTAVTVTIDTVAPVAVCQNVTVTLDSTGNGSTSAAAMDGGSTDNCSIASVVANLTSFNCSLAGVNGIQLTVTDGAGNTSTCGVQVTVISSNLSAYAYADSSLCGYQLTCNNGSDGNAYAVASGGCGAYTYLWSDGQTGNPAFGLGAGMYYVTVTDISGATFVDSVSIAGPSAITATDSATASCVGSTDGTASVFPAGGNDCLGYTFLWANGDTSASTTGLAPGPQPVTITDGAGCSTVYTVNVPSLPAPVPAFTQNGNILNATQSWPSYQWFLNGQPIPGANASSYEITQTGVYSLSVTDLNGCTGSTTGSTITGISGQMGDWAGLRIYPNPAQDQFKLHTAAPIGYSIDVNIHDVYGRTLLQQTLPQLSDEVAFDLRGIAAGTYFVAVRSETGQQKLFKLVVR